MCWVWGEVCGGANPKLHFLISFAPVARNYAVRPEKPFCRQCVKARAVRTVPTVITSTCTYSLAGSYATPPHNINPTITSISFSFPDCYYIVTTMSHLHAFRSVCFLPPPPFAPIPHLTTHPINDRHRIILWWKSLNFERSCLGLWFFTHLCVHGQDYRDLVFFFFQNISSGIREYNIYVI